ncbi:MAG: hypothetical protein MK371_07615 [SAR86 cluster bacterium]|nr:hypothetical protein [SAR86 cluster bacterium]
MKTFKDFLDELAPVKVRMDKSAEAKAKRREAKKDYKKDKIKINIARKKKKKLEKSSGVEKKREKMAAQGKTLGGERIKKRVV